MEQTFEASIEKHAKWYIGWVDAVPGAFSQGKTIEEAKRITEKDVLQELGGLPKTKLHCPKLAVTTLQKTIAKYEEHKRRPSKQDPKRITV